ncbi:hypothetical protein GCG54_00011642 [Colletotrichum gloeosporioides]|uniref:LysM domain-containing protein n=1 Tax=Colletotrichum gloeosporioides TaxID=474922 RepID=A0A8H4CGZ8_COLGL|nr:uncharacterized protein GCG54_00011642 [Colletotrichum gloeosporioides]KAF3803805.1 hypothetical protein GCG54_00011642 [Colletotrichum gloeosporioides]
MNTYCYYSEGMPSPTLPHPAPARPRSAHRTGPAPDPVVTPTPHQPNLTRGCSKFHKVASGQFCADVASEYGISLENF